MQFLFRTTRQISLAPTYCFAISLNKRPMCILDTKNNKHQRRSSNLNRNQYSVPDDLFNCGRICKYCGINIDTGDLESLKFFHGTCWQEYRKNNELYPFPENAWNPSNES